MYAEPMNGTYYAYSLEELLSMKPPEEEDDDGS